MQGGERSRRDPGGVDPVALADRSIDRIAVETARTLIEAYYLQDEREYHLKRGDPERAAAVGAVACDRMGDVWAVEFPEDKAAAREAGSWFVRGLFVQDEIENWEALRANADALRAELECDPPADSVSIPTDPRWETVRTYLERACDLLGIDSAYADRQTEFWRRHGLRDPEWQAVAKAAHTVKLRAMVADPGPFADPMGDRFVRGVELHDEWDRGETGRRSKTVEIVAAYYHDLLELRRRPSA